MVAVLPPMVDHGELDGVLPADGGGAADRLAAFGDAGVDLTALAAQLQSEGAAAFVSSWRELIDRIRTQRSAAG